MGLLRFTAKVSGRSEIGFEGERLALSFLKRKGLKILSRNYRFGRKEIDIVALDKNTVCFIEVKSRSNDAFGRPEEAVTARKRHHLELLALSYIKRYKLLDYDFRFDVVSVFFDKIHASHNIEYIEDAFDAGGSWTS